MIRARAGFTLLELLVVIAIIGILSTIGIVNLPRDRIQVREATRIITADINRARSEAIRLNAPVSLSFDLTGSSYTLYQDENKDWVADGGVFLLNRRLSSEFPLAGLASSTFTNHRVRFDVRGLPSADGTITISSKGHSTYKLDVVMASQGRLRVQ